MCVVSPTASVSMLMVSVIWVALVGIAEVTVTSVDGSGLPDSGVRVEVVGDSSKVDRAAASSAAVQVMGSVPVLVTVRVCGVVARLHSLAKLRETDESAMAPLMEVPVRLSAPGSGWQVATGVARLTARVPTAAPPVLGTKATTLSEALRAAIVTGVSEVTSNCPVVVSTTSAATLPRLMTWKDALVVCPGASAPNDPKSSTVSHVRMAPSALSVTWTRCWSSPGISVWMVRTAS